MKSLAPITSFVAAALLFGVQPAPALEETDQVSTGKVSGLSSDNGTLTIQSAQTHKPILYYGLLDAQITAANGDPVGLDSVPIGTNVTVHYTKIRNRLHVSRIVLPAPNASAVKRVGVETLPGAVTLPNGERRALGSDVLTDGDITTQPGSKALIDRDITTQPGSKATLDRDITTQPGSKAAVDRDITTQPGSKAAIDRDITTKPGKIQPHDGDPTTKAANSADKDGDITTKKAK